MPHVFKGAVPCCLPIPGCQRQHFLGLKMAATQPLVQVPLPQMLRDFFLPLSLEFSSLLFLQLAHCHLYAVVRRSRCCSQAEAVLRAKFGRGTQLAGSPRWSIYLKDCCLHTCCSRIRCLTASPHRSCAPLGQAITWLTAHGKEEQKSGEQRSTRDPHGHIVSGRGGCCRCRCRQPQ